MWTPTPCHCAGNVNYRQRSSNDDQGGDVALGVGIVTDVGILDVSVGINKKIITHTPALASAFAPALASKRAKISVGHFAQAGASKRAKRAKS